MPTRIWEPEVLIVQRAPLCPGLGRGFLLGEFGLASASWGHRKAVGHTTAWQFSRSLARNRERGEDRSRRKNECKYEI